SPAEHAGLRDRAKILRTSARIAPETDRRSHRIVAQWAATDMKSVIKASLLTLIVLAAVPRAFSQYNFSSWKADDGLPQNSVYAILQTRDGYLWFTTLDGLVRFDGVSFRSFSKSNTRQLKSNRFNSLLEDA